MKAASAELVAYLASTNQFVMADLFTFTLIGGTVLRYTSADIDIQFNGETYSRLRIERSKTKMSLGIEVDQLDIRVLALPTEWLGTLDAWLPAVRKGALDSARVVLERVFMPYWGDTSLGSIVLFSGRVSDTEVGRSEAKLTVKSELELFDTKFPRNLYQSGCLNTLYDNACSKNKATYAAVGGVTSAAGNVVHTSLVQPDGYFSYGTIKFTSGANDGVSSTVRDFTAGTFTTFLPFGTPPAPGDTFTAWPGCDKTPATCAAKFDNVVNFRGYPYVPDPETAV